MYFWILTNTRWEAEQEMSIIRRRIEIQQHTHILKADHCLKVYNVPFKLASPISG